MTMERLLKLPEKPGTVIAIGEWWLVRLPRPENAEGSWELLPFPTPGVRANAERAGVTAQTVYSDEWVLGEVEQEGGYLVISEPRTKPGGVKYWSAQDTRHEREVVTYTSSEVTREPVA